MRLEAFHELKGRRVRLKRFVQADITGDYLAWLGDREVMRFSNQRFCTHTRETAQTFLAGFDGSPSLFLSVRDKTTDEAIGTMTAYANPHHQTCDVGIIIGARSRWGGGYGSEAWTLLTAWLLDSASVRKLTAGCLAANLAMITLMERSGMRLEAVREGQELLDGEPCDIVHYAKFAR